MNIRQFFQKLFRRTNQKTLVSSGVMQADKSETMQKVLMMLSNTQDVELTCDDVFSLLDQFAELAAQGEDVAQLMPLVKQHLDMCEDCREEFKVLQNIVHGMA